jgi:hypothetical protein
MANNKKTVHALTFYVVTADLEEEGRTVTAHLSENGANIHAAAKVETIAEEFRDFDGQVTSANWRETLSRLQKEQLIADFVYVDKVQLVVDTPTSSELDEREAAAVLAGLRLLQAELANNGGQGLGDISDVLDNSGTVDPLEPDEIEELCERINFREAA